MRSICMQLSSGQTCKRAKGSNGFYEWSCKYVSMCVCVFRLWQNGYGSGVGAVVVLSFPMRRVASSNLAHHTILNATVTFLCLHSQAAPIYCSQPKQLFILMPLIPIYYCYFSIINIQILYNYSTRRSLFRGVNHYCSILCEQIRIKRPRQTGRQ